MKINYEDFEKCGIYIIINKINCKCYIGSSKNIYNRMHEHLHNIKYKKAHNLHLQYAANKYGISNFYYKVLEECVPEDRLIREQYYIDLLKPEYNKSLNVRGSLGQPLSIEMKKRISETLKNKYKSGEIKGYKQQHKWEKHYIYNVKTLTIEAEVDYIGEATRYLGLVYKPGKKVVNRVLGNTYYVSKYKFDSKNKLIEDIIQNWFYNSKTPYYILGTIDNIPIYFKSFRTLSKLISISSSTFFKYSKVRNKPFIYKDTFIEILDNFKKLPSYEETHKIMMEQKR